MKIVADENLAFTDYFFSEFGDIQHKAGRTLTHADVKMLKLYWSARLLQLTQV